MNEFRILVTGAAGYVGSVLCDYLHRRGDFVWGVDRGIYNNDACLSHLMGRRRFGYYPHDVRDLDAIQDLIEQADVVIPLAAIVGAPACAKNPDYAKQVNEDAVVNLVKRLSPNQRVIYPNTNSGYGVTDGESLCTEDDPLHPISVYGVTKCNAEKAVLDHPNGVSLRLATVFGVSPRMRFDLMVNDFTQQVVREHRLEVFEPHFKRNFVHVNDVARAFRHMVDNPDLLGVYNVGNPACNMTKLEVAREITNTFVGLNPDEVVSIGEGTDPDRRNYVVSNEKLRGTHFRFKYSLNAGVRAVGLLAQLLTPPKIQRMRNA